MDARRGIAALLLLAGCVSAPEPVAPAPKAVPQEEAAAPAPEAAPQKALPATPSQEISPARDDSVIVVDPGEEAPVGLVEASRAEKERRAKAAPSKIVINDKNLPQYAKKGQLTVADPKEKEKKAQQTAAAAAAADLMRDESYWRNRGLEIRMRWREAAEEIKELEQRAAGLRQQFYAQDDPYVRDGQIKPEWDRSLDRLQQAQEEAETAKKELAAFLKEGRVAGALPGWLREGIEHEPEEEKPKEEFPPHEAIEPPILDYDGGGR
jgi:hypothetical protein